MKNQYLNTVPLFPLISVGISAFLTFSYGSSHNHHSDYHATLTHLQAAIPPATTSSLVKWSAWDPYVCDKSESVWAAQTKVRQDKPAKVHTHKIGKVPHPALVVKTHDSRYHLIAVKHTKPLFSIIQTAEHYFCFDPAFLSFCFSNFLQLKFTPKNQMTLWSCWHSFTPTWHGSWRPSKKFIPTDMSGSW